MLVRVIDFETTGLPPDAAVCEIGWCDIEIGDGPVQIAGPWDRMVNPGRSMPIEAMAVHHIQDRDVSGALPVADELPRLTNGADVFCAHNAKFERAFFDGGGKPWICTYKCALRAWTESPIHSNQGLRYFLGLDLDDRAMPPHRAGPDAYVTAHILQLLLEEKPIDQLIKWSAEPAVLITCYFPKHKGKKWIDVPSDYLEWVVRQPDMDADIKHTANLVLAGRK